MQFRISNLLIIIMLTSISSFANRVIAHRGAWKAKKLPQNSIASLKEAIRLGCYGSEFDVRMTLDNILVVEHDEYFHGMDIEMNTYAKLADFKLSNGENLPLLEDYLKAGLTDPKIELVLEIKPSPAGKDRGLIIAQKVIELVNRTKASERITYISFDLNMMKYIAANVLNVKCQYLNGELSPEQLIAFKINGFDYHHSVVSKNLNYLSSAKSIGMVTNSWTVNDEEMIKKLFVHGIDFITTDQPEKALRIDESLKVSKWRLDWADEFNYEGLPDPSIWSYDVGDHGWGNRELQNYTSGDKNTAYVNKDKLVITASKIDSNKYNSARLVTRGLKSIGHGRVEVKTKLPWGRGIWPAIWMLGENISNVGWPACGEIDIMEHVGFDPDTLVGSIHTSDHNHIKGSQKTKRIKIKGHYDGYHLYAVEYDEKSVSFFFDDQKYYTALRSEMSDWAFDKPMYLLLNIAVGGNWGGEKGVDQNIFPQTMEVDYVRVFKK